MEESKHSFTSQHVRWDYCKMKIREAYIIRGRLRSKNNTSRLYYGNEEIHILENAINKLLVKAQQSVGLILTDLLSQIDKMKLALEIAKDTIEDLKNE